MGSATQHRLTLRDILMQAADTADNVGDHDERMVWEFAWATFRCDDGMPRACNALQLEVAYNSICTSLLANETIPQAIRRRFGA